MNGGSLVEQAAAAVLQSRDLTLDDDDHDNIEIGEALDVNLDAFTPRRGHSHKRIEDPLRNEEGKFICRFQNSCGGLIFDRKCEWSKHMDKHERPYKCEVAGCEKLQGFTYSGGLLRHQREVHKMHGGTKEALYCPFPNCKRSHGPGFTRKENRDEHLRRVHRRATDGIEIIGQKRTSDAIDVTDPLLDEALLPGHGIEDIGNENIDPNSAVDMTPVTKKRRTQTNGTPALDALDGDADVKSQMRKLQESNNWCYKLIQRLQEDNVRLLERINRLEGDLGAHLVAGACGIDTRMNGLE